MKQLVQVLLLSAMLSVFAFAQQPPATTATTEDGRKVALNSDGTWKFVEASSSSTLKIEAGIVYKVGGAQPVARTTFHLLDSFPQKEIQALPTTPGYSFRHGMDEFFLDCGAKPKGVAALIQPHIRYSLTTGFDGRATLADIKPGKYWLFGRTQTRGRTGCALWLMAVDLTKDKTLVLDQHNAAEAR